MLAKEGRKACGGDVRAISLKRGGKRAYDIVAEHFKVSSGVISHDNIFFKSLNKVAEIHGGQFREDVLAGRVEPISKLSIIKLATATPEEQKEAIAGGGKAIVALSAKKQHQDAIRLDKTLHKKSDLHYRSSLSIVEHLEESLTRIGISRQLKKELDAIKKGIVNERNNNQEQK